MVPGKSIEHDLNAAGFRVEPISDSRNTNGKRRIVRNSDGEFMGNFDALTAWKLFASQEVKS